MSGKFGFILVKPQLGENIGACARAMKNFGFSKLHIVEPQINFPNHKAKATSVGAYDIINKAKVCLLYTSPSPRDISGSRMPSSA